MIYGQSEPADGVRDETAVDGREKMRACDARMSSPPQCLRIRWFMLPLILHDPCHAQPSRLSWNQVARSKL